MLMNFKIAVIAFFLALGLGEQAFAENFKLNLDTQLPADKRAAVLRFLNEIESMLPADFKKRIFTEVDVQLVNEFAGHGPVGTIITPHCSKNRPEPKNFYGRIIGITEGEPTIVLNKNFLPIIVAGENRAQKFDCGHKNLYRLAQSSIIHNLAHLYDEVGALTQDHKKAIQSAERALEREEDRQSEKDESQGSSVRNYPLAHNDMNLQKQRLQEAIWASRMVTGSSLFWHFMGWDISAKGPISPFNTLPRRSPDHFEYNKIEEAYAVNFEYFILDEEFACRRPTVFSYFRHITGHSPAVTNCRFNTNVPLKAVRAATSPKLMANLDPNRIWAIDYIVAGRGEDMASRWGHAMFRIVLCAPGTVLGPECRQQTQHHVVASFSAEVGGGSISGLKALNMIPGIDAYEMKLSLTPWSEIEKQYNYDEARDIITFPLKLSKNQRAQFIYRLLEHFWQYSGQYSFLSNNCADEALKMVQILFPRKQELLNLSVLSPIGLQEALIELGISDNLAQVDKNKAIEQGHISRSIRQTLDPAFEKIKQYDPALPYANASDFFEHSKPEERMASYQKIKLSSLNDEDKINARDIFFLNENYILRKKQNELMAFEAQWFASRAMPNPGIKNMDSAVNLTIDDLTEDRVVEIYKDLGQLIQSYAQETVLDNGYGIITQSDFRETEGSNKKKIKIDKLSKLLTSWMVEHISKDKLAEIKTIKKHFDVYTGIFD